MPPIAARRCTATGSTWARSTPASWRSRRRPAGSSGSAPSRITVAPTVAAGSERRRHAVPGSAAVRASERVHERGSVHRPPGVRQRAQARHRKARGVLPLVCGRPELAARSVQSADRPALRSRHQQSLLDHGRPSRRIRGRSTLHRRVRRRVQEGRGRARGRAAGVESRFGRAGMDTRVADPPRLRAGDRRQAGLRRQRRDPARLRCAVRRAAVASHHGGVRVPGGSDVVRRRIRSRRRRRSSRRREAASDPGSAPGNPARTGR